jgi:hypothetical protein
VATLLPERLLLPVEDGPSGATSVVSDCIQSVQRSLAQEERSAEVLAGRFGVQRDAILTAEPKLEAAGAVNFVQLRTVVLDKFERDVLEEFGKARRKLESLDTSLSDTLHKTHTELETEHNKHKKASSKIEQSRQGVEERQKVSAEPETPAADGAEDEETKKRRERARNTRNVKLQREMQLQADRKQAEEQRHCTKLQQLESERFRKQRVAVDKRRQIVDTRSSMVQRLASELQSQLTGFLREAAGMAEPALEAASMARAAVGGAAPQLLSSTTSAAPSPIVMAGSRPLGVPAPVPSAPIPIQGAMAVRAAAAAPTDGLPSAASLNRESSGPASERHMATAGGTMAPPVKSMMEAGGTTKRSALPVPVPGTAFNGLGNGQHASGMNGASAPARSSRISSDVASTPHAAL